MSHEKEYIERHLGEPLTLALTDICLKRPREPILYMAEWLLHWKKNKDQLYRRRKDFEELLAERQRLIDLRMELENEMELELGENEETEGNLMDGATRSKELQIEGSSEDNQNNFFDRGAIEAHIPVMSPLEHQPLIDRKLFDIPAIAEEDENTDQVNPKKTSLDKEMTQNKYSISNVDEQLNEMKNDDMKNDDMKNDDMKLEEIEVNEDTKI